MAHNCIIASDGQIKCWGNNSSGELGLGDNLPRGDKKNEMGSKLPFVKIGQGLKVDLVATGSYHTCIHLTSNQLKCWGMNDAGQLGLGSSSPRLGNKPNTIPNKLKFVDLGTVSTPAQVVCGQYHTCALLKNKQVKCFGDNQKGAIGYEGVNKNKGRLVSDMGDNLPFVQLGTGVEVESIYSGVFADHNCVILSTTQLMKCWGGNEYGQLGTVDAGDPEQSPYTETIIIGQSLGTMGDNLQTVDLGVEDKVKAVSLAGLFTCALRIDDELKCWGGNFFGELGIGSPAKYIQRMGDALISTPYDSGKIIKQVSAGSSFLCLLYDDNVTVKCVGKNEEGQLGQGDTIPRGRSISTTFPKISSIDLGTNSLNISYIKTLDYATCVIFADYSAKCFGVGELGILGYGDENNIGDQVSEMGSNLPFINLLPPINSPTKAPTTLCGFASKKECKKDTLCVWKNSSCSVFDCSTFTKKKACTANVECIWNGNACIFK